METEAKTYNGWKNYETWAVALHLDNDHGTYEQVRETAQAFRDGAETHDNVVSGIWTADDAARFELADAIKDLAETLCGVGDLSEDYGITEPTLLAVDMIRAALSEVDWDEIARNVLSES
jgi:hypothetical protein